MKKIYFRFLKFSFIIAVVFILTIFGICKAFEGIKLISEGENISAVGLIHGADNNVEGIRFLDFNYLF